MSVQKVYLLTNEPKIDHYFSEFFQQISSIDLTVLSKIDELDVNEPDAHSLILNYETIIAAERDQILRILNLYKSTHIFIYNAPQNANTRLAFYELGIKRVYCSSLTAQNVANSLRWYFSAGANNVSADDDYSQGHLEDIALSTLIRALGEDRRTGALKIVTDYSSGTIYFNNGYIINAKIGYFSGQQALNHMLCWRKGAFTFSANKNSSIQQQMTLSVIGVLILGAKTKREFDENVKKIGGLNATLRTINNGDILAFHQNINSDFLQLISKAAPLAEVLENSFYPSFDTIKILIELKQNNFLEIAQPIEEHSVVNGPNSSKISTGEHLLSDVDVHEIKNNLNLTGINGKLIVLSADPLLKAAFLQILLSQETTLMAKEVDVEQLRYENQLNLVVFGLTITKVDFKVLNNLMEGLDGSIVLLDGRKQDSFDAVQKMVDYLRENSAAPIVLAVSNASEADNNTLKEYFGQYPIPKVELDTDNSVSIRNALHSLKKDIAK
jgi:hypothetical protein